MRRARQRAKLSPSVSYRSILHIGEEWVRALVVEIRPESVLVIGAGREKRLDAGQALEAKTLASVCEGALRQAENMTERTIGRLVVPDEAILGLPGRHMHSVIGQVQMVRAQPEREITERELYRLLVRLYNATEQLAARTVSSSSSRPQYPLGLLETKVIEIRVDGNEVTTPVRFRGDRLEARAVGLYADGATLAELSRLADCLELTILPVANSWAMASAMNEQEAVGLIVESHETVILTLRRGTVIGLDRLPHGGAELMRDLAVHLGLPRFRISALREAYLSGQLDDEWHDLLREGVSHVVVPWLRGIAAALNRLAESDNLPSRLCFCEMDVPFPMLAGALQSWMESWPVDEFPTVRRLDIRDIAGISERTGTLRQDPADMGVMALARYAGVLARPPSAVDALLQKIAGGPAH